MNYQKVAAGVGPVNKNDIFSGFELEEDEFLLIDPKEIDAIKLETKKSFELVQSCRPVRHLATLFRLAHYLVPADDLAKEAYRVMRDALRAAGKVGLGQITMRGREHPASVRPCGDGLLVETLRYADEVRAADPLFSDINEDTADADLLAVATALIDRKTAPCKAANFKDQFSIALREMIEAKFANRKTPRISTEGAPAAPSGNVIDLMAALKQSLAKSGGSTVKSKPSEAASKKAPAKTAKSRAK